MPVLLILAAGILWGCTGLFVRTLSAFGFYPGELVFIKMLVSLIVLAAGIFLKDRNQLKIHLRDIWIFFGSGVCSAALFNYYYFNTIILTSLSVAAVLLYTAPVFVMLLSAWLFHEALTIRKAAAIASVLIGCICVTGVLTGSGALPPKGIAMGLLAGFGYALYSIFSRIALNKGYSANTITVYTFFFTSFCFFFLIDRIHLTTRLQTVTPQNIIIILALSLFVNLIPFVCYTNGLKRMETGKAVVIVSIEPAAAAFLGILCYHEQITLTVILGILLVIGSIVLINTGPAMRQASPPAPVAEKD
ncbi:MAG: DMT family transporter [Spirochaetaceae bacterium]|jgi:drug/metabolite transporter (DMT)-like permease|nr:DMT family transporter [Spirochaetaceae bacterium]